MFCYRSRFLSLNERFGEIKTHIFESLTNRLIFSISPKCIAMIRIIHVLVAFFLLIILNFGCKDTEDNLSIPNPPLTYLLSWDKTGELSTTELIDYWGNNDTANAFIEYDLDIYRITYQAKETDGTNKILSGAILIPKKTGPSSVVAIQHATFFADTEAPSLHQGFSVVSRKSIFASHGYVVFLPDYYGYGVDKENIHPYHHAQTLAIASRDMILAGYEFLENQEIEYTKKLFLAGYLEGAYATAAAQQILEERSDLPFELTATSLGSGAYDMKSTFEYFTSEIDQPSECLACNAFLLESYNKVYEIDHRFDYYFQSPYDETIGGGLFLGAFDAAAITRELPTSADQLFNPAFIINYYTGNEPAWEEALTANSIHEWEPKHPTLLTHNQEDSVSPFFNSEALAAFNQNNENLQFIPIPNTNHFTGIFNWGLLSMDFFDNF